MSKTADKPNAQCLVVYDNDGKTIPYDTAYTDKQEEDGIRRCVGVHGKDSNVRIMLAGRLPPGGK